MGFTLAGLPSSELLTRKLRKHVVHKAPVGRARRLLAALPAKRLDTPPAMPCDSPTASSRSTGAATVRAAAAARPPAKSVCQSGNAKRLGVTDNAAVVVATGATTGL